MALPLFREQELTGITCGECGVYFAVPNNLHNNWIDSHKTFHCPNGHERCFAGETETEKLRRDLQRMQKEKEWAERGKSLAEKELARFKKRTKSGVCPCCKRTFKQLARHMASKHPEV